MLGNYATRRGEARYSALWDGRVAAWCPSATGPTGTRLYDLQAGRYQGTLTNMDAPTDWVRSSGCYALDFDGSNDYVTMSAIAPERCFSASLWFKAASSARSFHSLFCNSADANPDILLQLNQVSGSTYAMNFYEGSNYLGASASFTLDAEWHHYAWSTTGSGAVQYFRDGIGIGTAASSWSTIRNDSSTAQIGAIPALTGSGFAAQGLIDDAARYRRTLQAGDIRLLARRRGIAYELRRNDFGEVATGRRRRLICGAEC